MPVFISRNVLALSRGNAHERTISYDEHFCDLFWRLYRVQSGYDCEDILIVPNADVPDLECPTLLKKSCNAHRTECQMYEMLNVFVLYNIF